MAEEADLIVQVPRGSAVERQMKGQPPAVAGGAAVLVQTGATDAEGNLEPPFGGQVVLSVPSPETLALQSADVRRVIREAGTGAEPLVVVVESAEAFTDEELAAVIDAAAASPRPVILRVIRPSEI